MPLFSVIIPTYNRGDFIAATLNSVVTQQFLDYELIVIDDGCTDDTVAVLSGYSHQVKVLQQNNAGPGAARNLGISRASGEYVAFLDSDDVWFTWTLALFARLINERNRPAILSSRIVEFSDERELESVRESPVCSAAFDDYLSASCAGHFVGAGMAVIRRSCLTKAGGFAEQQINCEDHDLILRLGDAPGFVQVLAPVTLGWRRHACSATKDVLRSFQGIRYLVQQEESGRYSGGVARRRERREIIARHARPIAIACLHSGAVEEGWLLYRALTRWHRELNRWRYLLAFPLLAATAVFRRALRDHLSRPTTS